MLKRESKMLFNVPVVPDDGFGDYLNANSESFFSCYFSLHSPSLHDGRVQRPSADTGQWIRFLKNIGVRRKYLLMNSRAHGQTTYFDRKQIHAVLEILESMVDAAVLDGVVFADAYYLQALSDAGPEVVSSLEAVPSINHMLDSFDRVTSVLEFIAQTRFSLPGSIILDRSLNRRIEELRSLSTQCREAFPGIHIELLANEGCLYQCPFKPAHDCHISMVNMGAALDTHTINQQLGCMRALQRRPARLFKSPFIRPEDVGDYEPMVDILKICGRTLGAKFLRRVMDGYLHRSFSGNLLELLDAMEPMAQWLHVANEKLPTDFLSRLTTCSKDCKICDYCEELLRAFSHPRHVQLG